MDDESNANRIKRSGGEVMRVYPVLRDYEKNESHILKDNSVLGKVMMDIEEDEGRAYPKEAVLSGKDGTGRFEIEWIEIKEGEKK